MDDITTNTYLTLDEILHPYFDALQPVVAKFKELIEMGPRTPEASEGAA